MELAERVRSGEISAAELAEQAIRNIEALNPRLNALIHKTYEQARRRAGAIPPQGALAGVPFVVKDNATVAGVRLTRGSRALRDEVAGTTAPFFSALERAGMLLLGVTNMSEMGLIDGTENALHGPSRNPWHLDYSPGGSSGGSAAAVAAGLVPLAHGTDGGGSIRIPASHCALFGLKPSRGRVLQGRADIAAWPRLVDGVLSRSVRDSAMVLSVVEDPNGGLPPLGFVSRKAVPRLRIALMLEGVEGQFPHPQVRAAIEDTARLCSMLGHHIEEAKPPVDLPSVSAAARQVAAAEVAKAVDAIAQRKRIFRLDEAFESRALGLREQGLRGGSLEAKVAAALPIFRDATLVLDRFFDAWDLLLTPVVRTPVFTIGMRDQARFSFEDLEAMLRDHVCYTGLHNICGTPAMSVPLHWDAQGLPIGSQFAARCGAEATLLALAYELEQARPWAHKRAVVFAD